MRPERWTTANNQPAKIRFTIPDALTEKQMLKLRQVLLGRSVSLYSSTKYTELIYTCQGLEPAQILQLRLVILIALTIFPILWLNPIWVRIISFLGLFLIRFYSIIKSVAYSSTSTVPPGPFDRMGYKATNWRITLEPAEISTYT